MISKVCISYNSVFMKPFIMKMTSKGSELVALRAQERTFHWTWPILDYFCVIQPIICRIKPKWLF